MTGRSEIPDGGKTMSGTDVELGPVDYLVVAFPASQADFSGEMASELAVLMQSNTVRVLDLLLLLVWENVWAAPFASAVRRSGGLLVTSGRIPTQAILAAIDADRAANAQGG